MESLQQNASFTLGLTLAVTVATAFVFFYPRSNPAPAPGSKSPPYLTTFIPFLGRAVEMGQDIRAFILKYSSSQSVPIFSATIAGKHSHFLGRSEDILWTFSHPQLDMIPLHTDFMVNAVGMSRKTVTSIYANQELGKKLFGGFPRFLMAKESLSELVSSAQKVLERVVEEKVVVVSDDDWMTLSLMDFVRECIYLASVEAAISKEMATNECLDLLIAFDSGVPLAVAGAPGWCLPGFLKAREELVQRLASIKTESAWLADRRKAYTEAGYSKTDIARSSLSLLWAANGNSIPLVFWALANTLMSPKAYEAVKSEVDQAKSINRVDDLDQLHNIKSIFWETARIYFGGFNPRVVKQDFVWKSSDQQNWFLPKGTTVMPFTRVLHMDPFVFSNPTEFCHDRFVPDNAQGKPPVFLSKTGKPVAVSPFGGGAHYCPGRKFIVYEFTALVSLLIEQVEMRLVEGQKLPPINATTEGVGVSTPKGDIKIQVRRRKK